MNIKKWFTYSPSENNEDFSLSEGVYKKFNDKNTYIENNIEDKNTYSYQTGKVSASISENKSFIKSAFSMPKNFDFVLREFEIKTEKGSTSAFLIFYDGLVNKNFINRDILRPLMTIEAQKKEKPSDMADLVYKKLITQAPINKLDDFKQIIELVEFGNCAVFVDGASYAFVSDVKGWGTRSVSKPITEATLSGP